MKPRRLHKLTIFSMRCESVVILIIFATDEHRLTQIQTKAEHRRTPRRKRRATLNLWPRCKASSVLICVNLWLTLRLHFDLGLDGIRDEALLVRRMIHFFEFLRRG